MYTSNFFAKDDIHSINKLEELFKDSDKYVYFIEHTKTREWLTSEHKFTIVPLDALNFKNEMKAITYLIKNNIDNCIITEHQFIDM